MENKIKSYKKLNVEKCLSLINAIKAKPVVWTKSSKGFRNKQKQETAWKEIALREGYSVEEAKHQWQVLLSCYRTYKAKVKKSIRTATDCKDVYTPCWFAYKAMMFISENTDDSMLDTMHTVRTMRTPLERESPEPGPSQQHKYKLEETSCPAFALPPNSADSVSPDALSQNGSSLHSGGPSVSNTETASDRQQKPQQGDRLSTMAPSLMDLFDGTNQLMPKTSTVIGIEVARWIETFEPQQQNLAIGNLYIAMHQIEQDIRCN